MEKSTVKKKFEEALRIFLISIAILPILLPISGCGVRNANVEAGDPVNVSQFTGKRIAILPTHGDDSIGTDSQRLLKKKVNQGIDKKIKGYLPGAKIITTNETIQILNANNKLTIFDDLIKPYKNVGVFDSKIVRDLFRLFNCDYLVISTLDNENMDIVVGIVYLISLDIAIIDRTNNSVWNGTGDFKQGGAFGAGRVNSTQGAQEAVDLAFAYWSTSGALSATIESPAEQNMEPSAQKEIKSPARQRDHQVQSVQKMLQEQNYKPGPADGFMGNKTRDALKSYQKDHNIEITGRIDNATLVSLRLRQPSKKSVSDGKDEQNPLGSESKQQSNDDFFQQVPSPTTQKEEITKAKANKISLSGKYITTSSVELQSTDDFFADSLAKIPANTELHVLSENGDWYKVSYKNQVGYVLIEFVEKK